MGLVKGVIEGVMFPGSEAAYDLEEQEFYYIPLHDRSDGSRGGLIGVPVWVRPELKGSSILMIYAHGNGTDIGTIKSELVYIARELRVHFCAFDYPGYGKCQGRSSGAKVDGIVEDLIEKLTTAFNWPHTRVVLWGCSIGCSPLIRYCKKLQMDQKPRIKLKLNLLATCSDTMETNTEASAAPKLGGLILQCPFVSIRRAASALVGPTVSKIAVSKCYYNNQADLMHTAQPLLVIHGKQDDLFPWNETQQMVRCFKGGPLMEVYPELATHNVFDIKSDIIRPIRLFLNQYVENSAGRDLLPIAAIAQYRPTIQQMIDLHDFNTTRRETTLRERRKFLRFAQRVLRHSTHPVNLISPIPTDCAKRCHIYYSRVTTDRIEVCAEEQDSEIESILWCVSPILRDGVQQLRKSKLIPPTRSPTILAAEKTATSCFLRYCKTRTHGDVSLVNDYFDKHPLPDGLTCSGEDGLTKLQTVPFETFRKTMEDRYLFFVHTKRRLIGLLTLFIRRQERQERALKHRRRNGGVFCCLRVGDVCQSILRWSILCCATPSVFAIFSQGKRPGTYQMRGLLVAGFLIGLVKVGDVKNVVSIEYLPCGVTVRDKDEDVGHSGACLNALQYFRYPEYAVYPIYTSLLDPHCVLTLASGLVHCGDCRIIEAIHDKRVNLALSGLSWCRHRHLPFVSFRYREGLLGTVCPGGWPELIFRLFIHTTEESWALAFAIFENKMLDAMLKNSPRLHPPPCHRELGLSAMLTYRMHHDLQLFENPLMGQIVDAVAVSLQPHFLSEDDKMALEYIYTHLIYFKNGSDMPEIPAIEYVVESDGTYSLEFAHTTALDDFQTEWIPSSAMQVYQSKFEQQKAIKLPENLKCTMPPGQLCSALLQVLSSEKGFRLLQDNAKDLFETRGIFFQAATPPPAADQRTEAVIDWTAAGFCNYYSNPDSDHNPRTLQMAEYTWKTARDMCSSQQITKNGSKEDTEMIARISLTLLHQWMNSEKTMAPKKNEFPTTLWRNQTPVIITETRKWDNLDNHNMICLENCYVLFSQVLATLIEM